LPMTAPSGGSSAPKTLLHRRTVIVARKRTTPSKMSCSSIVHVAYRHGLRAYEVGLLCRNDADLRTGRLTVHRLKGSLSGVYPMQPDTPKLLKAYLRSREDVCPYLFVSNRQVPISRYALWHLMQHYGEAAGLPAEKRTFHILKHSIATHLLDAGADLAFVRDWLGHANIQKPLRYARLTTGTRDTIARTVFARPSIVYPRVDDLARGDGHPRGGYAST